MVGRGGYANDLLVRVFDRKDPGARRARYALVDGNGMACALDER
ncbi:MAG TPA: hypothetical protein VHE81_21215 [Lacipirellulaceae bacterium]|nr:hypothetical protein [Lacipirellulaceae bacterium]